MQIKVAKSAGFCFGVNRAVELVYKLIEEGKPVSTLGPIIHNPQLVDDLCQKGVAIVNDVRDKADGSILVIRSHGVPEQTITQLNSMGADYRDATCPFVAKIHSVVKSESEKGAVIFIAGDRQHPEVIGISGYCKSAPYVFRDESELEKIINSTPDLKGKSISAVAQTTFNTNIWKNCAKTIKKVYTNANVFDTICNATSKRQKEAADLSKSCDVMIIIGGRQSSNTAKLREVCAVHCADNTYLIETADELPEAALRAASCIGVTAGASTPAGIIKEVLNRMSELNQASDQVEVIEEIQEGQAIPESEAVVAEESVSNEASPAATEPADPAGETAAPKSIDEMTFAEALEESLKNFNTDQKVLGTVLSISPTEIQVDIGRKHAGYVMLDELTNDQNLKPEDIVKVGDQINLIVMRTNDQDGTVMLSKRRFDAIKGWEKLITASETGEVLDGTVVEVIRGGVIALAEGVRVFIPASQATTSRDQELETLLGQPVSFRIIEVNRQRRRAVGSIRQVTRERRKAAAKAFWTNIEAGQTFTGPVKSLTSYGAFVDLGGADGMVHISELSWGRIKHPSEIVNVGDMVEVHVKDVDLEKKKISLGYKKTEDNPWEILRRDYPAGTVVNAKIVGLTAFGAFASIIPGIDGLIHISQISNTHVAKSQDVLSAGQEVRVKITEIDFEKKRVSLSIKALLDEGEDQPAPQAEGVEYVEIAEEVAPPVVMPETPVEFEVEHENS